MPEKRLQRVRDLYSKDDSKIIHYPSCERYSEHIFNAINDRCIMCDKSRFEIENQQS